VYLCTDGRVSIENKLELLIVQKTIKVPISTCLLGLYHAANYTVKAVIFKIMALLT
jgi:hypothetical protein